MSVNSLGIQSPAQQHPGIEVQAQWSNAFYILVQGDQVRLLLGESIDGQTCYRSAVVMPTAMMRQIADKFYAIVEKADSAS